MGLAKDLVPLGLPPEVARRTGFEGVSVVTSAGTQSSSGGLLKGPGNKLVSATITSASDAVTLPSDSAIGDIIIVDNVTANGGFVFPQSGGTINAGTANQKATLGANLALIFIKATSTNWKCFTASATLS